MVATFVTTLDNPYDYWTQFDEWYAFDTSQGYNTLNYIGRIAMTSTEMSDHDYQQAVNDAVDEILRLNITGNYTKTVQKESDNDKEEQETEQDTGDPEEE